MRHPTDGMLRRLLDEPAGVALAEREHIASCEVCQRELVTIREDAQLVHAALGAEPDGIDVTAGWQRLSTTVAAAHPVRAQRPATAGRFRDRLRRPVVVGVAVAVVLTGAGTAAANEWLRIFQADKIVPVSISM